MGRRGPNKRAKGEGSIFQVRRGEHTYWCGQVGAGTYPNGKRRYVTVTRKRKSDVVAELDALKRRAGAGVVGPDQSVAQLLDEWLGVRSGSGKVSPQSLRVYRWRADHWIRPHVGQIRVRKLKSQHVEAMMQALEANGVSGRSANMAKSQLSSVLKWAKGQKRIDDNPCEYVEGRKVGAKMHDGLTDDEVEKVLAAARDDRLYALLYVSVTLGIREGEALGLHWSDVDLDAGELRVDMSKTRAGERTIPLVASTLETLREHRKRQAAERLAAGTGWHDHDLVFSRPDGRPIERRRLLEWWHKVCATAGIERRRWHALRHSAAGRMLSAGVPMELVSVVLGHSGIAITADVYARWSKDAKRRELGRYFDAENS
jgi:integrase